MTKKFRDLVEEIKNMPIESLPQNCVASNSDFEEWLHRQVLNEESKKEK